MRTPTITLCTPPSGCRRWWTRSGLPGAHQPILLGGLNYANDLSQWLTHEPSDPDGQLAASFHNYQGQGCDNEACWNSQIAPVAAQVPVVTGEFDQNVCAASTFDVDYMNWADQHGVGYLAWGWWVLSPQEIGDAGCSAYYLITDAAAPRRRRTGSTSTTTWRRSPPAAARLRPRLRRRPRRRPRPVRVRRRARRRPGCAATARTSKPDGSAVSFIVRADQDSSGLISARTVGAFPLTAPKRQRRRVSVGSVSFRLTAGTSRIVSLRLSRSSRNLLSRQRRLKVQITITLTNSANRQSVSQRTLTLKAPKRR